MQREESTYPQDWLAIAERDLDRVGRSLRDDDVDAAAFFLQQTSPSCEMPIGLS